jgi:hypothetical protein
MRVGEMNVAAESSAAAPKRQRKFEAFTNPVPETVTRVPPLMPPERGLISVTAAAGVYVKVDTALSKSTPLPLSDSRTVPAACAGVAHEMAVKLINVAFVASATPPKRHRIPAAKPVPTTVTAVPP